LESPNEKQEKYHLQPEKIQKLSKKDIYIRNIFWEKTTQQKYVVGTSAK